MNSPGHPVAPRKGLARARVLLRLVSFHLLWSVPAMAQRLPPTLGPLMELQLAYRPSGLAALRNTGAPAAQIAVAEEESDRIHLYTVARSSQIIPSTSVALGVAVYAVIAADLNRDGQDDLLALCRTPPSVCVLIRTAAGFTQTILPLEESPGRIAVADINNDRRPDILLHGRTTVGIQVFLGRPGTAFVPGPRLLPDRSVSDFATTDLNGDGITDIIAVDWLSDRVITFYGIGQGIFSEQVVLDVPGEPSDITVTTPTRARSWMAAVSFAAQGKIAVYEGNARGELRLHREFAFGEGPAALLNAPLNPDAYPELLALTGTSLAVFPGVSPVAFSDPVIFGPGLGLNGFAVADMDGDKRNDVAVLDGDTRRLILLGNSQGSAWPPVYAVGADPHGLTLRDVDGDGLVDILVANQGSGHLSVLRGRGAGQFQGQETIPVAPNPVFLRAPGRPGDPARTIVVSHATVENITIVRRDSAAGGFRTASIPTGAQPYVLLAKEDADRGSLEMLVRCRHGRDRSLSLSLFEQTGKEQFIERSLRRAAGGPPMALTVDDVSQNGRYDLLVVTGDRRKETATVSLAMSDGRFDFGTMRPVLTYADTGGATRAILTGFVNGDDVKDVLLIAGEPRNAIGILYGRGMGTFADSVSWISGVLPLNDDTVLLHDVDGNGATDIVFPDRLRNAVVVLYQHTRGGYAPPAAVAPAAGVTGMRIAALRSAAQHDLILSRGDRGTVSILFAPFAR